MYLFELLHFVLNQYDLSFFVVGLYIITFFKNKNKKLCYRQPSRTVLFFITCRYAKRDLKDGCLVEA